MKKLVLAALLTTAISSAHAQDSDTISSQKIGGQQALIGMWDMERTRQTATTPVTTISTLNVLEAISENSYRTQSESSSVQYMAEDQKVWTKGRCAGGVFSKKKKVDPCRWESKSKGVLSINGNKVEINYGNPSYLPDTLVLKNGVMEGGDSNGDLTYIKRQ